MWRKQRNMKEKLAHAVDVPGSIYFNFRICMRPTSVIPGHSGISVSKLVEAIRMVELTRHRAQNNTCRVLCRWLCILLSAATS